MARERITEPGERCASCAAPLRGRATFRFHTVAGHDLRCLACALQHRPTLGRSALIALLIGTVLTAINQGDVLLRGEWSTALAWKLPLTYAVPFFVATWGALGGARVRPFQLGR
jgi:hypothetical protein